MHEDPRYKQVSDTLPATLPPLTREEAERAAKRIFRHFGSAKDRGGAQADLGPIRFRGYVRRCWVSSKPTKEHDKGWGRLVHDVSHDIFRRRHPGFRPHAGGHAQLEREIAEFVVAQGWLDGRLKTIDKKPSREERHRCKLARVEEALLRWDRKLRRAQNALRKLRAREAALRRRDLQQGLSMSEAA